MASITSGMAVDETPSMALAASVMDELRLLDVGPPEDEYAGSHELPPAYNTFEVVYSHWCDTDKGKQDMMALDQDPAFAASETELKEAKLALKQMEATSKVLYEKSRIKRKSFTSYFGFGKSNRKASPPDASGTLASVNSSHSPMEVDSPATEMFKRAHEAEAKQGLLVDSHAAKVEAFKDKRQTLSNLASGNNPSWNRLHRVVEETLSGRAEVLVTIREAMEKLEAAEIGYNVAKKTASDLIYARLVVQNAHRYFTQTLKISDDIRGTGAGRALVGALGGGDGIGEMTKKIQYGDAVRVASKAQICLNELFRVMEPYENMLPADRMADYTSLKKIGLMQMSKIYNLMWGGSITDHGVAGSTKRMLEQQEVAFANLTPLAVWIQDQAPVYSKEADEAEKLRDDVRREVAAAWIADISISGQP